MRGIAGALASEPVQPGGERWVEVAFSSVLLVEQDPLVRETLERALLREGLQMVWARTSDEAERALAVREFCLAILNLRLGPEDGWQVYRRLRRRGLPIMLLLPNADPALRKLALAQGADDYLPSECGPDEVAARARFALRRVASEAPPPAAFGALALDPQVSGVRIDGKTVPLTPTEYALLAALVEARGRALTREQLVVRSRAQAGVLPIARSIDGHVRNLRLKLGDDAFRPRVLLSVRGIGYRLASTCAATSLGLAELAFQALAEPVLVVNDQQQVRLMNRAAEALVGRPAETVVDRLTCSALLRCGADGLDCAECPGLAALTSERSNVAEVMVAPGGRRLVVEETATPLPGETAHLLLQFRPRARG